MARSEPHGYTAVMLLRYVYSLLAVMILTVLTLLTSASATGQVIRSGPITCRGIALTFDMCPVRDGTGFDDGLIQMLIERHIPATFFLSGRWIVKHDEQLRKLLVVPHFELGTHGQSHAHLPLLDAEHQRVEILQPVAMLKKRYGYTTDLFRPPYGEFDERSVELTRALGFRFILWDVVSGDPDPALSSEQILSSVLPKLHHGTIVVFHGNGKGRHTRVVVEQLYEQGLAKQGLRPLTVSGLLEGCGDGSAHAHK